MSCSRIWRPFLVCAKWGLYSFHVCLDGFCNLQAMEMWITIEENKRERGGGSEKVWERKDENRGKDTELIRLIEKLQNSSLVVLTCSGGNSNSFVRAVPYIWLQQV